MDPQTRELPLLLILASTSSIFAWASDQWLFFGIFGAEAVWAVFLMALLLSPD
jgi:hypothetical protein